MKLIGRYAQVALLAIIVQQISAIPYGPPAEAPLIPVPPDVGTEQPKAVAAAKTVDGSFTIIGSSGVPAMHAALLQDGNIVFLDKVENYTELSFNDGRLAFSSVYDPETQALTPLQVFSNPFCSAGAFLADGRLVSLGGNSDLEWLDPTVEQGLDAIRYFDSRVTEAGWSEPGHKLASKRWYASSQVLGDGRIFVAAGSLNALDLMNKSNNNPTYEVLDKIGVSDGHNIDMDILVTNQPYWMYPFVHLLKDGTLFVFVAKSSQIFDVNENKIVKHMPDLPGMFRTYPNTGGSVMLPLTVENNYDAEIMVCGGGAWQGPDSPADTTCGLIKPLSYDPVWSITSMPEGRCMVEGTLLLDGTVLWLNGAQRGAQGFGIADEPALKALVFNPVDKTWAEAGESNVARLYHSVALMLLDGTVLVAGSNPNEMPILMSEVDTTNLSTAFPTEFRIERYTPSYLMNGKADRRPTDIWIENKELKLDGSWVCIRFQAAHEPDKIKVILYHGGFVTHSLHMGQVMVELEHLEGADSGNTTKEVRVKMPKITLAPGPYVVYVVVDGIPGIGQFVSVVV